MNDQNNNNMPSTFEKRFGVYDEFNNKTREHYKLTLRKLGDLQIKYNIDTEDYLDLFNAISKGTDMERKSGQLMIKSIYGVGDMED